MGNIVECLNNIKNAVFGKDVRNAIYTGIKQCYDDAIANGHTDMEVAQARNMYKNLNERLNAENADLKNQVKGLASGSPLVASSVDEMTDKNRVYVNTSNGHWYYHDGSAWIDSGVYQATEVATNSINTSHFNELISSNICVYNNAFDLLKYTLHEDEYCQIKSSSITSNSNSGFKYYDVIVYAGQRFKLSTYLNTGDTIYAVGLLYNDTVIDRKIYGADETFPVVDYEIVIPENVNRLIINCKRSYACILKIESAYDIKKIKDDVNILKNKFYSYDYVNIDISVEQGKFYNYSRQTFDTWSNGLHTEYIECVQGDKFKVTSSIQDAMCLAVFFDNSKSFVGYYYQKSGITLLQDEIVTIPENAKYVIFQCKVSELNLFKIEKYTNFEISLNELGTLIKEHINKIESLQNESDDSKFEIDNLQRRGLKNEKLTNFEWNNFDKSYFAFIIDDCNSFTPTCADLFKTLEVPLSSACIITTLNTIHSTANGRTVKEVLQDIVENGGEVLAHYSGNLADQGYTNGNYTFLTSDYDWKIRTRDVKKKLEEEGFKIRGLIRADSSQSYSNKGEEICRRYFDYSDQMGKSGQYKLGKRKFFIGVNTMQDMKAWIDNACNIPGFYPLCLHGNRNDEPLATIENLTEIINYIKSKGSNIAEITTYKDVFDKFGTTTLEKRLSALENN